MATVAQVAADSLKRILVQGADAPLEADEYADYLFALNNYMLALDADGITLGFTEVSDLGDAVTVPTGALRGIIANMAIEVAPDYNGQISPGLAKAAKEGLQTMRLIGQTVPTTAYPSTLPRGSGNYDPLSIGDSAFYDGALEAQILAETTGAISLENDTAEASP
jgi:hypothetical protein